MTRKDLIDELKKNGFEKLRTSKHETWSDGERKISLPRGNKISARTIKSIHQQINKRGPFYTKMLAQIG